MILVAVSGTRSGGVAGHGRWWSRGVTTRLEPAAGRLVGGIVSSVRRSPR